jgi:hypothetical protein
VLVENTITARGKGSGIQLTETYHSVFTLVDGKVSVMEIHVDAPGAFASIGLSRESA